MKAVGKWLARIAAGVISFVLIVVLLPHLSRLTGLLPDLSGRAETAGQVLSQRFQESARLETTQIEEEGIISSSTSALFLGTVQQVTIRYLYTGSLGIDLRQVEIAVDGGTLTLTLPPVEVLSDSLTPISIDRKDFWYPLTDNQRNRMLESERLACRERHLREYAQSDAAWSQVCRMLDATIAQWLGDTTGLTIVYRRAEAQE